MSAGRRPNSPAWRRSSPTPQRSRSKGVEHFDAAARSGGPWILVSGHFANWEIELPMAARRGVIPGVVYRAIANPHLDSLIGAIRTRAMGGRAVMLPKGPAGARATLAHLKAGGAVGMLVDQKMNDGIAANLFGRPAMTAPAAAHLALRFRCPLLPARAVRIGPARFRLEVLPPLPLPEAEDRHAAVADLTQRLNDLIEAWARERPAEWLWVHRRFDKALYADGA
ncbi:MAG: lysophospholipid acyltransferase family protein [Acetobacteraceae bacterium]|nr:lysophospholipid acyltransferase family protein [Acetobacteraceae bacterium]